MNFFTLVLIVSFLGAVIGIKKPWMGGIPGLLLAPLLFYFSISSNLIGLIISVSLLALLGAAYGCMASMVLSGLKGRGPSIGQVFMGGFGAHHPGGIILSDKEIGTLKEKNACREVFFSF